MFVVVCQHANTIVPHMLANFIGVSVDALLDLTPETG